MGASILAVGCTGAIAMETQGDTPGGSSDPDSPSIFDDEGNPITRDPEVADLAAVRVTMRRLNRAEYRNTIRDLLHIEIDAAENFPPDDTGFGYDNNSDAMSLSPLQLEYYLNAAELAVNTAFANDQAKQQLLVCAGEDAACANEVLSTFVSRAFRRNTTGEDIEPLLNIYEQARSAADSHEVSLKLGLTAALLSPHFLFRPEPPSSTGAARLLNDHELASRLSYFLWGTMPDDDLRDVADMGLMRETGTLDAQITRMLNHPKAAHLVQEFGGQWLGIRSLHDASPDREVFPAFSEPLRSSMRGEMENFVRSVLLEPEPVQNLLTANHSYIDETLANHYGIEGTGEVTLPETLSAGILSKAGWLTATSFPNRTSPVKRGVWVLGHLLCAEPPPPPPGVEGLEEGEEGNPEAQTIRERMKRHSTDKICASCHQTMDPIGFGLEGFDGIGRARETYENGAAVDTSGQLPNLGGFSGEMFSGARELGQIISTHEGYVGCVVEQAAMFGTGRGVETRNDFAWVDAIAELRSGDDFQSLIRSIVMSDFFRSQGAAEQGVQP